MNASGSHNGRKEYLDARSREAATVTRVFCIVFCSCWSLVQAQADLRSFMVANEGSVAVTEVYAVPDFDFQAEWGVDWLGDDVISPGAGYLVLFEGYGDHCMYHIRLVAVDGAGAEHRDVNLCEEEPHLVFSESVAGGTGSGVEPLRFTVLNRSESLVVVVQASLPSEDEWGADRLGRERLVPAGTDAVVEIGDHGGECVFDVRIVARDAEGETFEQSYMETDLCAVESLVFEPSLPSRRFTVVNQTNESILYVYAAADSADGWGGDRLGTAVVSAGGEFSVAVGPTERCVFDIRVVDAQDLERTFDDHDICQNSRVVVSGAAVEPEPDPETTRVAGEAFRDCRDWNCPWMVVIAPGSYLRGSMEGREDEIPVSTVTIRKPFAVGESEVTVRQFRDFVRATSRAMQGECSVRRRDSWVGSDATWEDPGFPQGDAHPVACVTWDDASAYAEWVAERTGRSYRLLTEAEWEYVARKSDAGRERDSGWANCGRCGSRWDRKGTSPVGSFPADAAGLRNVFGNVWEWVHDCYAADYTNAPRDGSAWDPASCSRRVLRGGSWFTDPDALRASIRNRSQPDLRHSSLGFRLARDL